MQLQSYIKHKISQSSCRAFIFHISHSAPLCPYYYSAFKFFRLTFGYCPVPANTHTLLDQCSFELINICGMIQNEQDNSDWVQTLSSPTEIDHTLAGRCRGTEQILYITFTPSYIRHKSTSCSQMTSDIKCHTLQLHVEAVGLRQIYLITKKRTAIGFSFFFYLIFFLCNLLHKRLNIYIEIVYQLYHHIQHNLL